jgi:KaiC/GvpD/RAD55 family RecA-like ATPase
MAASTMSTSPGKLADELAAAGALVADGLPDLFAPGWDSEVVAVPEPTGLDVIDNGLGGGLLPGEVLMVLAAMGTGKTLLMVQLLVEQCRRAAAVELDTGRRFGVVFVSTEPTQVEVRDRAVICGAEIPRGRYEALPIKTMLCDRPAPGALPATRYELDRFKGRPFRPEKERAAEVADLLRKHLLYVDLTEHNPAMRGVAPTVDVAAVMAAEEVKRRKLAGVRFVLLDHVSAMATSLAMGARDPDKAEIGLIRSIPKLVRDRLGAVYGCPAVVTHQFSGEANGMSPYATLHHAQSRGSKMAAEFVDFALCVGVPALVDGQTVAQFQVTKPRRTGRKPPGVLRVDGEYGRLVDASGEWTCDPTARQFVPASARHASAPAAPAPGLSPVPAVPPGLDVS